MVFSSLFFLCNFLPVSLGLYYIIKNRTYRNCILILTSLLFYAWGEPVWVVLLVFSTFLNYFIALGVEKYRGSRKGKAAVAVSILLNLAVLAFFKYSGFIVDNINGIFGTNLGAANYGLPVGISFYTFKIISYVVDVYRGEAEAQKSPFKLLLYVSLFHHLTAGPIVRYKDIAYAIDNRCENAEDFNSGVSRFIAGLGKKVIIANTAANVAESIMGTDYARLPVLGAWFGIILFAIQIYFDFSGYSDMALGLGKMFGFTYKENFNYPYVSRSVTEFWRRWHISLGSFFRDYLYIPLGGNRSHMIRNLFIVWLLTGLWHGAGWNFVIWGLYYFILLLIEKMFLNRLFSRIPAVFSRIYLWIAVLVGWVFFCHTDLSRALQFLGIMFGAGRAPLSSPEVGIYFRNNVVFLILALIGCTPAVKQLWQRIRARVKEGRVLRILDNIAKPAFILCVLVLSIVFLAGQSYNPFLYFKF